MSVDAVTRLRVLAARLHAPLCAEEHLELPFERVWAVVADLASERLHDEHDGG
ncbi:hypothetical protein JK364_48875 [Streptomyces sp. 110]|uniref:Uncharacterized protein n=1 Tax=Streptomyces endocoffeicus TaxID=2898945 RepID=A0ABS1Q653_9ACTN|nr:hypothetical protein [Streptomyces endocoffeicus]MBL1120156.1 hypothetical protein [Streptomyces endocoffeicus]